MTKENEDRGASGEPADLRERVREGLRLFEGYLEQPAEQRAAGADALLERATRAHQELNRLLEQAMAAYLAHRDDDVPTDPRMLALQQTPEIARKADVPGPAEIGELADQKEALWVADGCARYAAFVVAALTVQDALLDEAIGAEEYTGLLADAAEELAAAG